MTISFREAKAYLHAFDFKRLFVDVLGWSFTRRRPSHIVVAGQTFTLTPIAEQGGMPVFLVEDPASGILPEKTLRKRIDTQVSKIAYEHILIFVDAARAESVWQWVKRADGASARAREHAYRKGQPGDSLLQKLDGIAFKAEDFDEEGRISITRVTPRVAKAFDVERVTKRFYEEFKDEHAAFLEFLRGVEAPTDRAWYASVMLNRLMFIYFIQKKGFLAGDPDYLRHRLSASQAAGPDRFYAHFLKTLFFEGFARDKDARSRQSQLLLGDVPYLNGGLFLPHSLEQRYGDAIHIPDALFARLFDFFDKYDWRLDDRPLHADNEVNPDVLGYIFEKYINQKQMGAYYTKEDITGYICRNTILPFLLDKLANYQYGAVHPLPLRDVEPYIYPAVKQAEYLPTETAREYAARQKRLAGLRADFAAGKIAAIDDLITYNLDIERFAKDWLRGLADPLVLRAFYFECLKKLTVLDPTVGSGAFLFAAMNILEPLYEICLDKMAELGGPKYPDFRDELARVAAHPNRRYFIFKSIIVHNLYGVDIMDEAVEICKLRLFLKLVAQIDDARHIEPLPDIDFNIRAGNTLVGYASLDDVERAASQFLFSANLPQQISGADRALRDFRDLQTRLGISGRDLAAAKESARAQLADVEKILNETLCSDYGQPSVERFIRSHRPFHWYVEFNQIMQDGGFDVIVGNPPYVEYQQIKDTYTLPSAAYLSEPVANLYAFCMERASYLLTSAGRFGMIVPAGLLGLDEALALRQVLQRRFTMSVCSTYAIRPSKLFDGVDQRLCIFLGTSEDQQGRQIWTTRYHHWHSEERESLFALLQYYPSFTHDRLKRIPQIGTPEAAGILAKIEARNSRTIADFYSPSQQGFLAHYHRSPRYWIRAMDFEQYFKSPTRTRSVHHFRDLRFRNIQEGKFICALLNSSLFFFWFLSVGNGRNLTGADIESFPIGELQGSILDSVAIVFDQLMVDYKVNSFIRVRRDCEFQEFRPSISKPILDRIDYALAQHYGFTDEELDFIINYDIKYRMGAGEEE